jgi:hypothetical protein
LSVGLQGLWRKRRIPLGDIRSAVEVQYDPAAEYGGYGIRAGQMGLAYIATGNRGVRVELNDGRKVLIGSQRAGELARSITQAGNGLS